MQTAVIRPFVYQRPCLRRLRIVRKKGIKKALVVMASGLGKTVTVAFELKNWLSSNKGSRVLYLCHQNDILSDAREKFEKVLGKEPLNYGYYHGEIKEPNAQILFASFQTMRSHMKKFQRNEFKYIIIDESHHTHAKTYKPVVEYFQPKFLLGVTATPDRTDLRDIRDVFGRETFSLNLPEALANRHLAPVDYRLVTDELVELSKIKNSYKLTLKELNKRLFIPKRDNEIAKIIRERTEHIKNPRIMIFCRSIKHAERFCNHVPGATPIHSKLSQKEQLKRLTAFRQGLVSIAVTVDKFNEGIDIPEINVIVFLRSTQSNTIFYQQLGRGLRKIRNKKGVLVLDFVANCERIKMIHDLVGKIREIKRTKRKKQFSDPKRNDIIISGLKFIFTEKALDILQVFKRLERKRAGYSKEGLIEDLKSLASKIKKPPTMRDVITASKNGQIWSYKIYVDVFGSFEKAKEEAGFDAYRKPKTKRKELIIELKTIIKEFGGVPTELEMKHARKSGACSPINHYIEAFGSFNKAVKSLGLKPRREKNHDRKRVISYLRKLAKKEKRLLKVSDVKEASKRREGPSAGCIYRLFGSFGNALASAGLK